MGPNGRDYQLLVEYDNVVAEPNKLQPCFRVVILDICRKMATGTADSAHKARVNGAIGFQTREDFDLYCRYVAGFVGEGVSRLFAVSGKEAGWIGGRRAAGALEGNGAHASEGEHHARLPRGRR